MSDATQEPFRSTVSVRSLETHLQHERLKKKRKKLSRKKSMQNKVHRDFSHASSPLEDNVGQVTKLPPDLVAHLKTSPVVQEALKNITKDQSVNCSLPHVMESFLNKFTAVLDKYLQAIGKSFKNDGTTGIGNEKWTTPSYETVRILASSFLASQLEELTKGRKMAFVGAHDNYIKPSRFEEDLKPDACKLKDIEQARAKRQLDAFLPVIDFFNVEDLNKVPTTTTTKKPQVFHRMKATGNFHKSHGGPLYHVGRMHQPALNSHNRGTDERKHCACNMDAVRVEPSVLVNRNAYRPPKSYFRTRNRRNGLVLRMTGPYLSWPVFHRGMSDT